MARVKRGVRSHAKHKKVLEQAKGFYGRRKNTIRTAKAAVDQAGQYAYRDRAPTSATSAPCGSSASTPPPAGRLHLLAVYPRPGQGRDRDGPQGPGRHRRADAAGFAAIAAKVRAALA